MDGDAERFAGDLDREATTMRDMHGWRYLLACAIGALAWGCSGDDAALDELDPEIGVGVSEIRGGRARDDHSEVAQLWMKFDGEWGSCTATLIDRKIAITAAHCLDYRTNHSKGNYGYLEVKWKTEGIDTLLTTRYRVDGYHHFAIPPFLDSGHDIALVRLATSVPCEVARPAGLAKNPPPAGTIVSKWGYGGCDGQKDRKRARHLRRGQSGDFGCSGDSGGPTLDPKGAVYAVHSSSDRSGTDYVTWVGKNWNGINRIMDRFGRAGRCR
jgi:hypothetical protein